MHNSSPQNQPPKVPPPNWQGQRAPYGAPQQPYAYQGWPPQKSGLGAGAIIAIVIGGLVLLSILVGAFVVGVMEGIEEAETELAEEPSFGPSFTSTEVTFVDPGERFGIRFTGPPDHDTQYTLAGTDHTCPYDYDYYRRTFHDVYDVIRYAIPEAGQETLGTPEESRSELRGYMELNARGAEISSVREVAVDGAIAGLRYRIGPEEGYNGEGEYFEGLYTHILGVWTKRGYYEVIVYSFDATPQRFEGYFDSFTLYGDHVTPRKPDSPSKYRIE